MLDKLRHGYGSELALFHSTRVVAFPTLDQLLLASEEELRTLGFGYRYVNMLYDVIACFPDFLCHTLFNVFSFVYGCPTFMHVL